MKNVTGYDIGVFEREDCSLCFGRTEKSDTPGKDVEVKELHLYRVQLSPSPIYVLASDPNGAILQAHCVFVKDPKCEPSEKDITERVPFGLRGWSGNQF